MTELIVMLPFLAHLSKTRSRGAYRVVLCPSSVMRHWEVLFKNCSQNLIPSKTLVAMETK